jgi:hypothetical protein
MYMDWFVLAGVSRNIDYRLIDTWLLYKDLLNSTEGECEKVWNYMKDGWIIALHMWQKKDNFEQYKLLL